ncbi:MAG: ABC transporter permease [Dehalococcoidia bacterium]
MRTIRWSWGAPTGKLAAALLLALLIMIVAGPFIGPDPSVHDIESRLAGPSISHPLGTDHLGRDLLGRVAGAARGSVTVGLSVAAISGIVGGLLGLASGYIGGWLDLVLQRVVDSLMAIPLVVLALAVVAAVGPGRGGVIAALSVAFIPLAARVARSSALSIRQSAYVEAARAMGAGDTAVILRHVLPNAAGPWMVVVSAQVGGAVLAEAALSFLGAAQGGGSLGAMLGREAQTYMYASPWIVVWPGLALALVALAMNLAGDAVADASTPGAMSPGRG